ncbi:hypothetical protein [Thalassotalea piscium]|uniref:Uncharacterized protein n=1 Tax=Thalassotalea piscium TaxID=1230533 RepID=A0A7X0NGS6_9GAMM|nr:hypothetical protein [Thalassotalea piscium]MBB6543083.1 hypothetical protein [Thalassotalea piscium]
MSDHMDSLITDLAKKVRSASELELDELSRRELIKHIHLLESTFLEQLPFFTNMMAKVYAHTSKIDSSSKLASLSKIAKSCNFDSGFDTDLEGKEQTKKDVITFNQTIEFLLNKNSPFEQSELELKLLKIFRSINWSGQIRLVIYAELTKALDCWDIIRKRLNRLLKEKSASYRVNKFEYLNFLSDIERYPLPEQDKDQILKSVDNEAIKLNDYFGISLTENFELISQVLGVYSKYAIAKKAVLLSVNKYIIHVSRNNGFTPRSDDEFEIVNSAMADISSVLYRYKTEKDFIPFVHTWTLSALVKYKTSKKFIRAPMQIEQKRGLIYNAYHSVARDKKLEHQQSDILDIKAIALKLKQLDPSSQLSEADILLYLRTEDVGSLSQINDEGDEVWNSCDLTTDNSLYGKNFFTERPDVASSISKKYDHIMKAIEGLNEIDRTIIKLKINQDDKEHTIKDIAKLTNLSYDQTRRRLEKCYAILESYIE